MLEAACGTLALVLVLGLVLAATVGLLALGARDMQIVPPLRSLATRLRRP